LFKSASARWSDETGKNRRCFRGFIAALMVRQNAAFFPGPHRAHHSRLPLTLGFRGNGGFRRNFVNDFNALDTRSRRS
jgi:hypothetical protein